MNERFTHQDMLLRMLSSIQYLAADAQSVTIFAVLSSAKDADDFCSSGHPDLTRHGVQALSLARNCLCNVAEE